MRARPQRARRAISWWHTALATTLLTLTAWAETAPAPLAPTATPQTTTVLVDRIVAVVDGDPILRSDLERVRALGLATLEEGEEEPAFSRRVLDGLIDQRLRLREVDRYGVEPVPSDAVETQLAAIRARFADERAFVEHLATLALDEDRLRHLLRRQLRIASYVESRLGPRVVVDLDTIRGYYDGRFQELLTERGDPIPPIDEVREAIRALLYEEGLNREIDRWTETLRQQADIVDLLDRTDQPLPKVVERIEGRPDPGR